MLPKVKPSQFLVNSITHCNVKTINILLEVPASQEVSWLNSICNNRFSWNFQKMQKKYKYLSTSSLFLIIANKFVKTTKQRKSIENNPNTIW